MLKTTSETELFISPESPLIYDRVWVPLKRKEKNPRFKINFKHVYGSKKIQEILLTNRKYYQGLYADLPRSLKPSDLFTEILWILSSLNYINCKPLTK